MKLSTNSAVTRLLHEGITDIDSLIDFDKDSIESLPRACSRAIAAVEADADNDIEAEAAVPAGNLSTASVHRLIVAANAARYYRDIGRTRTVAIMHYNNILAGFKLDFDAYCTLKKQDAPDVPLVYDKDKDKKVIKWAPLFLDAMSRTFGAKGPLRYVLRENAAVPAEAEDPLSENCHYSATAGSMLEELIRRLPHSGPTFRDDNKTVFMGNFHCSSWHVSQDYHQVIFSSEGWSWCLLCSHYKPCWGCQVSIHIQTTYEPLNQCQMEWTLLCT